MEEPHRWQFLHPYEALHLAVGDIDGGGADDLIVDFATYGLWSYRNNTTWGQLNPNNVTALTTVDLDNNGKADVVASFATYGIWIYRNNTNWTFLHPYAATVLADGQLDGGTQADLVVDFGAGNGVWMYAIPRVEPTASVHQSGPRRRRLRRRRTR